MPAPALLSRCPAPSARRWHNQRLAAGISDVNLWYLNLGTALLVMFFGLFIHWTVVLAGALMPFWMVLREWRRRRAAARTRRD